MSTENCWTIEYTYPSNPRTINSAINKKQQLSVVFNDERTKSVYPLSKRELSIYHTLNKAGPYGLTAIEISQEAQVNYNTVRRILGMWKDIGILVSHEVRGQRDEKTKYNCYVLSSRKDYIETITKDKFSDSDTFPQVLKIFLKELNKRKKFVDLLSPRVYPRWSDRYLPYYGD